MKECECINWARTGIDSIICGKFIPTNHHINCSHYNDSIIDIYKVTIGGISAYIENEKDARDSLSQEDILNRTGTVEKIKIHREVFENLPEFEGF